MSKINWREVKLHWYGTPPDIPNCEEFIIKDCESSLGGLEKVSELLFHIIPLAKSYEYDIITVWGESSSENILHCQYDPKPHWISLDDWKKQSKD